MRAFILVLLLAVGVFWWSPWSVAEASPPAAGGSPSPQATLEATLGAPAVPVEAKVPVEA